MTEITDDEIREVLTGIDESVNFDVSDWEAEFLESLLFEYDGPMSEKQRDCALRMIEKYEERL